MKLDHPFSQETRNLFLYTQFCWLCPSNGNGRGGLEIHHICGRKKHEKFLDSAFNASVLCKVCHDHIKQDNETRFKLYKITAKMIYENNQYEIKQNDFSFIKEHCQDKFGKTANEMLQVLIEV